jgi:hypothetical protein
MNLRLDNVRLANGKITNIPREHTAYKSIILARTGRRWRGAHEI